MKNKKGASGAVGGIDVAIKFFGVVISLLILGFLGVIVVGNLGDTENQVIPLRGANIVNETLASVDEAGEDLSVIRLHDVTCTIVGDIINSTNATSTVPSTNYTQSNCNIVATGGSYNNTNWDVTFDYTFRDSSMASIVNNGTQGMAGFFSNVPTWFTLLSVAIIISIVVFLMKTSRKGINPSGAKRDSADI